VQQSDRKNVGSPGRAENRVDVGAAGASAFTGSSGDETIITSNGNDTITGGVGARRGLTPAVDAPFDFIFQPVEDDFDRHQVNVTHLMIPSRAPGYSHLAARL
jgi:Ca2+-binding RTX toxin-like protein